MYKFRPIVKTLVWGTEKWVISGVSGNESVVAEGPEKGKSISEIHPGAFPLLIKFIDAHDDLSIQVHPDDALAAERHNCKGKTEMWYVTAADEGAHLLSGLSRRITPDEYERMVEEGTIEKVLSRYDVHSGDVFFLPAGRIHAIGGGCHIAEIQQTSDITYRIYDYGRKGLDGKPRELHTGLAKDAIDYNVLPDYRTRYRKVPGQENLLVRCPFFTTSLLEACGEYSTPHEEFLIVVCLDGEGSVNGLSLKAGESGLIMNEGFKVEPSGQMNLLTVRI